MSGPASGQKRRPSLGAFNSGETPPSKAARSGSRRGLLGWAAAQARGDPSADGASSVGDAATLTDVAKEDTLRQCAGCFRVSDVDGHFWMPNEPVPNVYTDQRGNWCKDCHTMFKVYFKATMTIGLFGRWLKQGSNREQFIKLLVSALSLKYDGISHIAKAALEQRLRMLQFVFSMLGYPFPLAAAAPISEVRSLEKSYLVPMSQHPREMMVLVPRALPQPPPVDLPTRFVTVGQSRLGWPLLPFWSADSACVSW